MIRKLRSSDILYNRRTHNHALVTSGQDAADTVRIAVGRARCAAGGAEGVQVYHFDDIAHVLEDRIDVALLERVGWGRVGVAVLSDAVLAACKEGV